jgi:chemotaxis protein CheX
MNRERLLERIESVVESSARALFAANGLALGKLVGDTGDPPRDHDIACSIGFTSGEVSGAVLMTTRKDIIARTWPTELRHREPTENDICDWAGELVNQLLGRVKNVLARSGVTLQQCTPTVVLGWHVHRGPACTTVARAYAFGVEQGLILVYFDAAVGDTFVLPETEDPTLASVAEGGVELF